MAKVTIKQIKSGIKRPIDQKRTLKALGLNKLHRPVVHEATPQIMGMIKKVKHMLSIEEK